MKLRNSRVLEKIGKNYADHLPEPKNTNYEKKWLPDVIK